MKYLVLVEKKSKVRDAEVQFKFRELRYERIFPDRFIIHCNSNVAKELNDTFEWMACICTE